MKREELKAASKELVLLDNNAIQFILYISLTILIRNNIKKTSVTEMPIPIHERLIHHSRRF